MKILASMFENVILCCWTERREETATLGTEEWTSVTGHTSVTGNETQKAKEGLWGLTRMRVCVCAEERKRL